MTYREVERTTTRHNVLVTWRCVHCRALAVVPSSDKPPAKCGKCHL